ncbi:MAG TPA: hypothetical protein VFA93_01810 [Patescibacteria group bacterium]|nr:hypothetical protein [Patescibacteria group bacterium]
MVQKKKTQAIDSIGESKNTSEPVQFSNFEHNYSPNEVRTLISWSAPGRPFKKRTKQFYLTAILVTLLVEVILFLFSQLALMAVVISLLFMSFVLASVPPKNFQYRISSEGITIEDHSYIWMELYDFYFKNRNGVEVLHIRTRALFPGELTLTLGDLDKEHVKSALLPHLPYRETIQPTFMERSADWLSRNFPLEPGN